MTRSPADMIEFRQRLLKSPSKRAVIGVLLGMGLFLVPPAVWIIRLALCPDVAPLERSLTLLFAAALLFLPVRTVWVNVRRKWKTGRWSPSTEERLEIRAKWATGPNPLQHPAVNIAITIVWVVVAGVSIRTGLHDYSREHRFQLMPIVIVGMVAFVIWSMYRKQKPASKD